MYNYSVFLKNISDDNFGINNLELKDGVFGKNLADVTGDELENVREMLLKTRRKIVLYTVSYPICDYDKYVQLFRKAHLLNIENISLCLSTLKSGYDGLEKILELARAMDIKVVFEPKAEYDFFDLDTYSKIKTAHTGLIFNPTEYLKLGLMPFLQVLNKSKIKDEVVFLRINDGLMNTAEPTLPEQGNSEVKECASTLISRSFKGYFSFNDYYEGEKGNVIDSFASTLTRL